MHRFVLILLLSLSPIAIVLATNGFGRSRSPHGTRGAAEIAIELDNYSSGDVIRYPVVLIRGRVPDRSLTRVALTNRTSNRTTHAVEGLAFDGRFKVLAELAPGENDLLIEAGGRQRSLKIRYLPQTNDYRVRVIYATASDGDTSYQTPVTNDPQNYEAKISTAMKLMQTMTAERLGDLGFGRRTFNLELDDAGDVVVHGLIGELTADQYDAMSEEDWWRQINREVRRAFPDDEGRVKNVVIASYTRFDPVAKEVRCHTALGGGDLALFGSGNLFTWPGSIAEAQAAFMDERRIDRERFMDDSRGRGTWWGAASTTMGATLHELGHTFDLPHSRMPSDIMTRGFDRFNRVFTFVDPLSDKNDAPRAFAADAEATFAPVSAAALAASPWFAQDEKPRQDSATLIELDESATSIVASSPHGICFLGVIIDEEAVFFRSSSADEVMGELSIPLAEIPEATQAEIFEIRAVDGFGNVTSIDSSDLLLR